MKICDVYINSLLMFKKVKIADTFFSRFKGLMGVKSLTDYSGVYIFPCKQIHTFFMKMKIDVIFIDKNMTIVNIIQSAETGKIYPTIKTAYSVLELESDIALKYGIRVGDKIKIEKI